MLLTPERSMRIQNRIGANVIMALDDVVSSVCLEAKRFEEATHRTLRWIDRCIAAHQRPSEQALFGIIQGGVDLRLRSTCIEGKGKTWCALKVSYCLINWLDPLLLALHDEMNTRDAHLPGYAIGGLAGGEEKDAFCRVVAQCASKLPVNKPRYVMGVGYPLDLVVSFGKQTMKGSSWIPHVRWGLLCPWCWLVRLRVSIAHSSLRDCFGSRSETRHHTQSCAVFTQFVSRAPCVWRRRLWPQTIVRSMIRAIVWYARSTLAPIFTLK